MCCVLTRHNNLNLDASGYLSKTGCVPEDDETKAATAIAENASISTLNVYPEMTPDEVQMDYSCLPPTEITGRQFNAFTSTADNQ